MNKTIEFVEKIIKNIKRNIEENRKLHTYYLSQEYDKDIAIMSLETNIKYLKQKLSTWEQIKCELDAWEEIAPDLKEGKRIDLSYILKWDTEKANKILKALGWYDE